MILWEAHAKARLMGYRTAGARPVPMTWLRHCYIETRDKCPYSYTVCAHAGSKWEMMEQVQRDIRDFKTKKCLDKVRCSHVPRPSTLAFVSQLIKLEAWGELLLYPSWSAYEDCTVCQRPGGGKGCGSPSPPPLLLSLSWGRLSGLLLYHSWSTYQ